MAIRCLCTKYNAVIRILSTAFAKWYYCMCDPALRMLLASPKWVYFLTASCTMVILSIQCYCYNTTWKADKRHNHLPRLKWFKDSCADVWVLDSNWLCTGYLLKRERQSIFCVYPNIKIMVGLNILLLQPILCVFWTSLCRIQKHRINQMVGVAWQILRLQFFC
jgi:hypothetical protein